MSKFNLQDAKFHDSIIKSISYSDNVLTLYIPESYYENTYKNSKIIIDIDKYDLLFYYVKRYPLFHRTKLKGKEFPIESLTKLFQKGKELLIEDIFVSPDINCAIIECIICPFSYKKGIAEKLYIKLSNYNDIAYENIDKS